MKTHNLRTRFLNSKMRKSRMSGISKLAIGLGVLGVVSIGTGILLAPQAGKETREEIMQKAANTVGQFKYAVKRKTATAKDSAKFISKEAQDAVATAFDRSDDVKKVVKHGYHDIVHDFRDTAKKVSNEMK